MNADAPRKTQNRIVPIVSAVSIWISGTIVLIRVVGTTVKQRRQTNENYFQVSV